jgi:hypothetical protein
VISALYLVLATLHALVWSWGSRAWERAGRPAALALVLVPATLLWYDNLRIGLGRVVGEGPLLYALSVPALAWHWTMLPLFVLAALAIARGAGLRWARTRWAGAGFGALAAGLFLIDVPYALGVLFGAVGPFPAVELKLGCIGDAIRYTATLTPAYFCGPEAEVHRVGPGPVVAIVMNAVVLAVGVALWARRGWPWLAASAGFMFAAAAGGPAWGTWAPPVANVGEVAFVVGLLASARRFAPEAPSDAPPVAPTGRAPGTRRARRRAA